MKFIIGVDTGGTFTDCVAIGEDGSCNLGQSAHDAAGPHLGILECYRQYQRQARHLSIPAPRRDRGIWHRFHRRVNALLARGGAKTGLLTTRDMKTIYSSDAFTRKSRASVKKKLKT